MRKPIRCKRCRMRAGERHRCPGCRRLLCYDCMPSEGAWGCLDCERGLPIRPWNRPDHSRHSVAIYCHGRLLYGMQLTGDGPRYPWAYAYGGRNWWRRMNRPRRTADYVYHGNNYDG